MWVWGQPPLVTLWFPSGYPVVSLCFSITRVDMPLQNDKLTAFETVWWV